MFVTLTYEGFVNPALQIEGDAPNTNMVSVLLIKRVRPFVSMHTAIKVYKGLIEPHCDHCSAVWDGLTQQRREKLQKLQNRAIRVITKSSYDTSSRFLLNTIVWDNL